MDTEMPTVSKYSTERYKRSQIKYTVSYKDTERKVRALLPQVFGGSCLNENSSSYIDSNMVRRLAQHVNSYAKSEVQNNDSALMNYLYYCYQLLTGNTDGFESICLYMMSKNVNREVEENIINLYFKTIRELYACAATLVNKYKDTSFANLDFNETVTTMLSDTYYEKVSYELDSYYYSDERHYNLIYHVILLLNRIRDMRKKCPDIIEKLSPENANRVR